MLMLPARAATRRDWLHLDLVFGAEQLILAPKFYFANLLYLVGYLVVKFILGGCSHGAECINVLFGNLTVKDVFQNFQARRRATFEVFRRF